MQTNDANAKGPIMTLRDWSLLILLGTIWGSSFVFAKIAVAEIPAFTLVFLRVAIACATLLLLLWLQGKLYQLEQNLIGSFLVLGLLNNAIPFSLLFLGQTAIGAGLASILNATTPIFTVIIAGIFARQEPVNTSKLAGISLGIVGVAVMLSNSLSGLATDPIWAQACCIGAAISYGCAATFARKFAKKSPEVVATGQLMGSSLIMLPLAIWASTTWHPKETSIAAWGSVIALSIVATAFAYLLYFRILRSAGATNASLVTLLVPASALVLGGIFLSEKLQPIQIVGLAILFVGLLLLDGRLLKKIKAS